MLTRKPTWKQWLFGILVWVFSYLVIRVLLHGSFTRDIFEAAVISAFVGVSVTCLLQLRRWRKTQAN